MSHRHLSNVQFADETLREGGLSVRTSSGFRPRSGWMVSRAGHEEEVPERQLSAKRIGSYRHKHYRHLREPGVYFGTWRDPGRHVVDLDESERYRSFPNAQLAGVHHHQRAVFNMATGHSVHITGPGALGQVAARRHR